MPTLSMTRTMARVNGEANAASGVREVIGDGLWRPDGRDRVLEDHLILARLIEHEREAIEVLDAAFDLAAVHHPDQDGELLAADVVQEDVLNVGSGLGIRGGHQRS